MTKAELGDMIIMLKGYSNQDKKLDERLVWILADSVLPKLIQAKIKQDGEDVVDQFLKSYTLPILSDGNKKYLQLPTYPVNINGKGLKEVSFTDGENNAFAFFMVGEDSVYWNLEAGGLVGNSKAKLQSDKVYVSGVPPLVEELLVKYVPKIKGLNPEDEIPVPSDYELDLISMIREQLREQKETKEDKYNDSEQLD